MKKSKFSDRQIIEVLKRIEGGLSVPKLCRELGALAQRRFTSDARTTAGWIRHGQDLQLRPRKSPNPHLKRMPPCRPVGNSWR